MRLHDLDRVVRILNGVVRLPLFNDRIRRNALRLRQLRHHVRFHVLVVRGSAGHDDPGRHPGPVLAHALQHPLPHLRPRRPIGLRRITKHDDRVKVRGTCIRKWKRAIDHPNRGDIENDAEKRSNDQPAKPDHSGGPFPIDFSLVAVDRIELSTYGL